ncbi:tail length tape measure protein [Mycobacterium phage Quesadilla]|uniref:Tape measure protein n=1 Tax=Mycobacterium phage Quesadilla TaxID=2664226 RepID=A0A5Q2W9U2_9CAUD|nr:tail length tape measure protein [Mycobacterium phage Quesadilla]QGH75276.1 tape measure protein [Mycobacterium phage Quesadilla]
MTDVGKISLGVEIDASDLSAKLGEAVRRAIAPALAEIQRELNAVQREYDQTARAGEKAGTAQAAAAKIASDAVHNIGEETDKVAAKTRAASGVSTRSINAVTRAWEKQTAAIAANTAARAANAAAPTGGGPGGGSGGGSGGGGPPVDRHRGGFMQGGRGRFGFLTSPLGMNAVALGVGSLGPALAVVTDLVGGVQQLAQAGLAIPGVYGAAGASIGVAMAGFKGMGDAISALNDALKSGDPKDMEKATEALKDMDPAAVAVAKSVANLNRGPLLDLRKNIQSRMFRDWAAEIDSTAGKAIPRLSGGIGKVADAWNGTLRQLTAQAGSDRNLSLMDHILGNTAEGQTRLNKAIAPLSHAILTLTSGSSNALPRLADGLAAGAERFDKFITHAVESGDFDRWMNNGITGMRQLAESGLNLVKTITNITHAAGSDQGGFLRWLNDATGKLEKLTGSASGQAKMAEFFREGREMGKEWLPILENIGKALIEVYEASRVWSNILLPFLRVASDLLTAFPGLITAAGVALLAWKTSSIFKPLISGLDTVIGKLGTVAQTADLALGNTQAGRGGISGAMGRTQRGLSKLGGARGTLGLGGMAAGTAVEATADDTTGQVVGALTTVASGALAGSVFGPVGTAVGAGVGAAIAGVTFLLSENAKEAKEAADAQAAYQASLEQSREALLNLQGAQKEVNDSLLAASGNLADQGVQQGIQEQLGTLPESLKAHYGEDAAKGFSDSLTKLGLSNAELAQQLTGSQPVFDALRTNLQMLGPDGAFAAQQLQQMRDQIMGMQQQAQVAGPAMQNLATILQTDVAGAAGVVRTSVASIPQNVPIDIGMPNAPATVELLRNLGYQVDIVNGKPVVLNANSQAVTDADKALEALGIHITHLPTGNIQVQIDQGKLAAAQQDMNSFFSQYQRLIISPTVQPPGAPPQPNPAGPEIMPGVPFPRPGGADGMVIPGYAPGRDIVNAVLAPGEGVLIPEAVRGLGGASAVYGINSMFRSGLSKRYYDDGGVQPGGIPHLGTGAPPGPEDDYLKGIYDVLTGREAAPNGPLQATSKSLQDMLVSARVGKLPGMSGGGMGPFGTPLKVKNRGYDAAKGALEALGFDAETIIGSDPVQYFTQAFTDQLQQSQQSLTSGASGGLPGAAGMPGAGGADFGKIAAGLVAFSHSGNLADVAGLGLNANSPVITAITSARNKKAGLADEQIADLIQQVVGGPGYTGVLDEKNSSLVKSLQAFHDQTIKKGGVPGAAPGTATGGLNFDALAKLEAGGNWANTSNPKYSGGLQFDQATWDAYKPPGAPATAAAATREQQIQAAMNAMQQGRTPESLWPQNYSALYQPGASNVTGGIPASAAGAYPTNGLPGASPGMMGDAMGLISFAQQASGGAYKWGASDLAAGLSDCSGAVSDLVELITKGQATPERLFDTSSAAGVLKSLGAVQGAVPGMLQIGWSDSHMRATLPNGVNFESGGATGQGATYGGNAQGAAGMPNIMSLPAGNVPMGLGGMGGAGAMSGGVQQVYVVNMPGAGGFPLGTALKPVADGLASGAQEAAGNVIGDLGGAVTGAFAIPEGERRPNAELAQLVGEQNPMALAAALGFNVQDFTRQGGVGAENIQSAGGFDASGRIFSDTAGLMDRTLTSLSAQLDAMRQQLTDVVQQVADKLNSEAVTPIIKAGVQEALGDLKDSVLNGLGTSIGQAAAPPIAEAVKSAVASLPVNSSGAASQGGDMGTALAAGPTALMGGMFADGGPVWGGKPNVDSVPAMLMPGEFVFNKTDVARMGGASGAEAFRQALAKRGGIRRMATGGGVDVSDIVGAEWFGVSEVPIISTIVNLLIRVLLKMIGVTIEARDTMTEMAGDFRQFRGDAFKAFDAQGRLLNDTSGLIERSSTSEETAAAERIRILKIVIQAIIKYLIEKVIVPIAKAVANSVIQAGASAAGAAVSGAGGGPAGGIVSSVISSAGQAGVEIAAEVGTDFALAMSETIINMVAEGLMSQFGDQMTGLFGGAGLAGFFDPAGGILATLLGGVLGMFTGLLGGTLGGAGTMIPGDALFGGLGLFDEGGMAEGVGFLPKATAEPELVLSPTETSLFSRFVNALERGGFGRGGDRTVNAPITVIGGRETPEKIQNRLLQLMP